MKFFKSKNKNTVQVINYMIFNLDAPTIINIVIIIIQRLIFLIVNSFMFFFLRFLKLC